MGPATVRNCALGRDDGSFVVASLNTSNTLQNITGTIVLAGAGKMGGAMLTGWLAQGLDPGRVVGDRAHPSPDISALAAKGIALNPVAKRTAPSTRWWSR